MDPAKLGRPFHDLPETAAGRAGLLGGFAVGVAGAFAAGTLLRRVLRRGARRAEAGAAVDRAGEESFPASDPTTFTAGAPGAGTREERG
jgi:hypothetical protein